MEYHIFVSGNLKGYISKQDSRAISEYMKQNFPAIFKNFAFADEHYLGGLIADAEHEISPRLAQLAARAAGAFRF